MPRTKDNNVQEPLSMINYKKLAEAIVQANRQYDEEKLHEAQLCNEKELEEWHKKVGYNKNKPITIVPAFFRMLIMNHNDIKGDRATSTLLSFVATSIMSLGMFFMFALMLVCIIAIFVVQGYVSSNLLFSRIMFAIMAFLAFILGNLFRISIYEIQNMHDRDYLNTILSSILTIVGTVLALVELFRG